MHVAVSYTAIWLGPQSEAADTARSRALKQLICAGGMTGGRSRDLSVEQRQSTLDFPNVSEAFQEISSPGRRPSLLKAVPI